jgi:hypothetical protein
VTVIGSTPRTINPCVVVPEKTVMALRAESGRNQSIPVQATLQGKPFKANVVRYRGAWQMYLNGVMRKAAGVDVGDRASVTLKFDAVPRLTPMPPALAKALKAQPRAKAEFDALSPSRRKELLRYLGNLKQAASLERNIGRMLRYLLGRKTDASPTGLYRVATPPRRRPARKFRAK